MSNYRFSFSKKWVFSFLSNRYLYDKKPTGTPDEELDRYCRSVIDIPAGAVMHKQLNAPECYGITITYRFVA